MTPLVAIISGASAGITLTLIQVANRERKKKADPVAKSEQEAEVFQFVPRDERTSDFGTMYPRHPSTATPIDIEDLDEPAVVPTVEPSRSRQVPDEEPENWDWAVEWAERELDPNVFAIHLDEYKVNLEGLGQEALIFYAGDEVLTDEEDVPINDITKLVGDTLHRFGEGSGNPDVVYVQNVQLACQYEITRTPRAFADIVFNPVE